jgi:hypothetical protein
MAKIDLSAPGYSRISKQVAALAAEKMPELLTSEGEDGFIHKGIKLYENTFYNAAAIVARKKAKSLARMADALSVLPEKYRKDLPVILPTADPKEFHVYPNLHLKVEGVSLDILKTITWFNEFDVLEPVAVMLADELNHEKKRVRWETTQRGLKYLLRREKTTLGKALVRFTKIQEEMDDAKIRNTVTKIENELKPLEILIAKTPEQFIEMYGSGPTSCMTANGQREWKFLIDQGRHPADFYGWSPEMGGAYIIRKGVVVCRAVLFGGDGKGNFKEYGRIYSANEEYTKKFIQELKNRGMNEAGSYVCSLPFDVPGAKRTSNNDYVLPIPFCDNLVCRFDVTFDNKTNVFHVVPIVKEDKHKLKGFYLNGGQILLSSQTCTSVVCDQCKTPILMSKLQIKSDIDGKFFCSAPCAEEAGYFPVIQANGVQVWRKDGFVTSRSGNRFTNYNAADANGYYPYINNTLINKPLAWENGFDYYMGGGMRAFNLTGFKGASRILITPSAAKMIEEGASDLFKITGNTVTYKKP